MKEETWELEEEVMAVAYSLWESHSTGVSLEAENRTGWGTLPLQEFIAGFSTDTMEDLAPLQAGPRWSQRRPCGQILSSGEIPARHDVESLLT